MVATACQTGFTGFDTAIRRCQRKSTVNILRALPPRGPDTKPLLYRLQFEPAPAGARRGTKPTLRIQFVAEGAGATGEIAATPTSRPQIPSSITEADFPIGGFTAFMKSFPDEVLQLFNWTSTMAPVGTFSRVVRTSTASTGHETSLLVTGTKTVGKTGTSVSNIGVRFLAFSAPVGMGKPGTYEYRFGYRDNDAIDFTLEQLQARKTDALGRIADVATLPRDERIAVKYAIWQYFENGTRNAEVDAIVPIPGGKRRMLYKIRFEPRTNNVHVRSVGEEGKDVVLDPAKRKLDVRNVKGFDPKANASTLKSWISNRYKGVAPAGTTVPELVTSTNTKMDAGAGTKDWFANNYAMPVLNERQGDERLQKVGLDSAQRAGMKHFEPPELRLVEISLEQLSDPVLDLVRGTALVRQESDISKKLMPASGGKPAHWVHEKIPDTAGQTWATRGGGGDRTIVVYNRISLSDRALFAGDPTAGGNGNVMAFGGMTVLHEVGHVIAASGSTLAEFNKKFGDQRAKVHAAPVTRYAAKAPDTEFFPEAFAIYNSDPNWMRENLPGMFAWFEQLAKKGTLP